MASDTMPRKTTVRCPHGFYVRLRLLKEREIPEDIVEPSGGCRLCVPRFTAEEAERLIDEWVDACKAKNPESEHMNIFTMGRVAKNVLRRALTEEES